MFYGAYLNPRYQLGLYPAAAAAVDIIRDTMFTLDLGSCPARGPTLRGQISTELSSYMSLLCA